MTLASKITLVRVAMIPAFMVTMYLSGGVPGLWMYVSHAIFIVASLTDSLEDRKSTRLNSSHAR